MNERIKELSKQAEQYALDKANKGNDEDYDYSFDDDFQQKFAELIVRECLSIVEPTEDSGDEWCVTLKGTAQEIKKHFGVEE